MNPVGRDPLFALIADVAGRVVEWAAWLKRRMHLR